MVTITGTPKVENTLSRTSAGITYVRGISPTGASVLATPIGGTAVTDYGAAASNTAAANVTAIQAMIDAGVKHIHFPDGTFNINNYLDLSGSSVHTISASQGAVIVQNANYPIWYHAGVMNATRYYLTGDAAVGDDHVVMSAPDVANFAADDWIFIRGTETTPGVTTGSRVAMIRQVTGTGSWVYVDAAIYRAMTSSGGTSAYVTKFTPGSRITFEGGTYKHVDKTNTMCLFDFLLCYGPDLNSVRLEHSGAMGLKLAHCIGGSFNNSHIFDLTDDIANGHPGYGVALCGAVRGFRFNSGSVGHVRHAITTGSVFSSAGGYDSALPLPADVLNTVQGAGEPEASYYGPVYCYNTTNAALDSHEQGYGFTIIPNVHGCFDGVLIRADEANIIGGTILNCRRSGVRIDFPASNAAATNPIKTTIKGLSIINVAQESSDCYGIWAEVAGATIDISDIIIRGNFLKGIAVDPSITIRVNGGIIDGTVTGSDTGIDANTQNVTLRNLQIKNCTTGVNTHSYQESDGFSMRHIQFSGNTTDVTPTSAYPAINDHDISQVWHITGKYYANGGYTGVSTSNTLGNDSFRVAPFQVKKVTAIDRIGCEVTVAGSAGCTVRMGIYASDTTGYPSSLVLDGGTIPGDAVAAAQNTVAVTLQPGLYWLGAVIQGSPASQPTLRTVTAGHPTVGANSLATATGNSMVGYSMTAAGALPGTFTAGSTSNSACPRVCVRIA